MAINSLLYVHDLGFDILPLKANEKGRQIEFFTYGGLAILFQPFLKIALGKQMCNLVDLVVGVGLIISIRVNPRKTQS